jgi:hypothetical protein
MFRMFSLVCCALIACDTDQDDAETPLTEPVEDPAQDPGQDDDSDTAPDSDVDLCAEAVEGQRFEGSVVFEDGTVGGPGNVHIAMCCADGCQTPDWGAQGFCFTGGRLEPGEYAFKVMPIGTENHATPLSFITVGEADIILDAPVVVPEFSHGAALEDGIFDAGNGLQIEVVSDFYSASAGVGDDYIASVHVDLASSGLPLEGLDSEKVVGVWYLGSFNADIYPLWTFEVHDTGLPEGTKVDILNGSYADSAWLETGTATVDADGTVRADLDSGISILSTLVLVEQ